jgi:hypothetical protein
MSDSNDTRVLFHHIVLLTLLGMGVVFLAGPLIGAIATIFALALTAVGVILPFALLGLLVWLPFRLISCGHQAAWEDTRRAGRALWWAVGSAPVRGCVRTCSGAGRMGQRVKERVRSMARPRGGRVLEILCGAPVGALIGAAVGIQGPAPWLAVLVGALAGAVLGYCVGASRAPQHEPAPYADDDMAEVVTPVGVAEAVHHSG